MPTRLDLRQRAYHSAAAAVLIAALLLPTRGSGQAVPQELRVDRCPNCRLTQRVVATLGHPDDSVLVVSRSRVVRLGGSRYLVGPVSEPGQLAIYRSDGTLERVIGRAGSGPLEFSRRFGPIIGSTVGSAVVVDRPNARLTLIDSTGKARPFGRFAIGSVFFGASLPDGRLVINAEQGSARGYGLPLHLVADGGRVIRSFGTAPPMVRRGSDIGVRVVAPARGGRIWFTPVDKYELSLADSLGRIATILTRPFASPPPNGSGALMFFMTSIHEDHDGLVWVVWGRRRAAPAFGKETRADDPKAMKALAAGLTSTIDIIDAKRGSVVYSQAMDDGLSLAIVGDGLAYRYREDAEGNPRIELISLRLSRPN